MLTYCVVLAYILTYMTKSHSDQSVSTISLPHGKSNVRDVDRQLHDCEDEEKRAGGSVESLSARTTEGGGCRETLLPLKLTKR